MYQHKYFNLCLHNNDELEDFLQTKIIERKTLHEWPLSCVEQLITREGKKWIYKSQYGPTVESEFYGNARSRLLVTGKTINRSEAGYVNMLLEFIEDPLFEDLNPSDETIVAAGHHIIENIAMIEGKLPHYLDISERSLWEALMEKMLENLEKLVSQEAFQIVDGESIRYLRKWVFNKDVLSALERKIGFVHHDLSGDNIFVMPDGYRIIDWQRPVLGPTELDLAILLYSMHREVFRYVDIGVVGIMHLLRIEWFTECAAHWFPEGRVSYDKAIEEIVHLLGKTA